MKKNRLVALLCVAALLCVVLTGCVNTASVGKVNNQDIPMGVFNMRALSAMSVIMQEYGISTYDELMALQIDGQNAKDAVIERTFEEVLNIATAERLYYAGGNKLTADHEAYITSYISSFIQQVGGQAQYEKELKEIGLTAKEFQEIQRSNLVYSVYMSMIFGPEGTQPLLETDVLAYYNANYVAAKHILFMTIDPNTNVALPEAEKAQVLKNAQDVLARLQAGEDFDTLMNTYNEDPGVAENPYGYAFTTGQMVAPFETAAFALDVDELSGLVETSYGYHIIKGVDKHANESLYAGAVEYIQNIIVNERFAKYIEDNKAGTSIIKNEEQAGKLDLGTFFIS